MAENVQTASDVLFEAAGIASTLQPDTAPNGIRFAVFGDTRVAGTELQRMVQAVPAPVAAALDDRVFYFVPLAIPELREGNRTGELREQESGRTLIARDALPELFDEAICHRNVPIAATSSLPAHEGVFISSRLLRDTFALAFEFFINVGHAFSDRAGIPEAFTALAWEQAVAGIRGETSQDAFETRAAALAPRAGGGKGDFDEKARVDFMESSFADALAIYQLSLAVDFDYAELREREYPLLAPAALAARLRLIAQLFPPNAGYEFLHPLPAQKLKTFSFVIPEGNPRFLATSTTRQDTNGVPHDQRGITALIVGLFS